MCATSVHDVIGGPGRVVVVVVVVVELVDVDGVDVVVDVVVLVDVDVADEVVDVPASRSVAMTDDRVGTVAGDRVAGAAASPPVVGVAIMEPAVGPVDDAQADGTAIARVATATPALQPNRPLIRGRTRSTRPRRDGSPRRAPAHNTP